MLPYTLDENFTFGYGAGVYNPLDKSPESQLYCTYARCTREPGTFREECVRTALLLADQAKALGRDVTVMLSGGMDSEVVTKAFIEAGVTFKLATFTYPKAMNEHELQYVRSFTRRHGLKTQFVELDMLSWIQTEEAAQLVLDTQCQSIGLTPHMRLMQRIWDDGGMPVLGNGDVYLERLDGQWMYVELEYMLSWYRFAILRGILGGIGFFQHTPEITLSMLREPAIEKLGTGSDAYANKLFENSRYVKYKVYKKHWPDLQDRMKFTGNELVKQQFDAKSMELYERFGHKYAGKFKLPYVEFRAAIEP